MDNLLRILFALIMLIAGGAMAYWLYRPAETYPTCHYTAHHSCR